MVPRRRAEQQLAPLALPLPTGPVPVRRPGDRERPPLEARARVRAPRHGRLRRRLLGRRGPLRQGRSRRHPHARRGPQSRARDGDPPRAPDAMVPQHLVVGTGLGPAEPHGVPRRPDDRGVSRGARPVHAPRRRWPGRVPARAARLRQRDEHRAAVRRDRRPGLSKGRHQRPCRVRGRDGQAGRDRDEGRGVVSDHRAGRRGGRGPAPPPRQRARERDDRRSRTGRARSARRRLLRGDDRARERRRCVLRGPAASRRDRRGGADHAPGLRRDAVEQADLLLQRLEVARRRRCRRSPAERAVDRPERRLASLRRGRHPVDARQVGVPVVRRVGPRVPHRRPRAHRPRLRQVPAPRPLPGVVPEPQRRAAGVRVELRRREPAGPRLGGSASLGDRRPHGPPVPRSGSSTSC